MERHEGLIAVVAFESLVKIVAFLLVAFTSHTASLEAMEI